MAEMFESHREPDCTRSDELGASRPRMPKNSSSALILRFDAEQLGGRATEDQKLFGIAQARGLEDEIDRSIAASNGDVPFGIPSGRLCSSHDAVVNRISRQISKPDAASRNSGWRPSL